MTMDEDQILFFARRLPGRLNIDQTAKLLQFHPDSLDYLISIGLLDVLGGYMPGSQKMFSATYIMQLSTDVKWLGKATSRVRQHVQKNNALKREAKQVRGECKPDEAA